MSVFGTRTFASYIYIYIYINKKKISYQDGGAVGQPRRTRFRNLELNIKVYLLSGWRRCRTTTACTPTTSPAPSGLTRSAKS